MRRSNDIGLKGTPCGPNSAQLMVTQTLGRAHHLFEEKGLILCPPIPCQRNLHRVYSPCILSSLQEYLVAPVPLLKWITTYYACVGSITFRENAFRNGQFHETDLDRGVTDPNLALCLSLSCLTFVNSRSPRDARIFN